MLNVVKSHVKNLLYVQWNLTFQKHPAFGKEQGSFLLPHFVAKFQEKPFFFKKLKASNKPYYEFWEPVALFLFDFPNFDFSAEGLLVGGQEFFFRDKDHPEKILLYHLLYMFFFFRYFPKVLGDLFAYYPEFQFKVEKCEFLYLEFWIKGLKVLDDTLNQLLLRGVPFLKPIPYNYDFSYYRALTQIPEMFLPPVAEAEFNLKVFNDLLWEFFSSQKNFLKILNLFLEATPEIFNACKTALKEQGLNYLEGNNLMRYFLLEYLFKDVSIIVKRLILANITSKDVIDLERKASLEKWFSFSAEERARKQQKALEYLRRTEEEYSKKKD